MIASMASLVAAGSSRYQPIPAVGIDGPEPLAFPVYLCVSPDTWVLYGEEQGSLGQEQIDRLLDEGTHLLFIRPADRQAYLQRIEARLDGLMQERSVALERRADVLLGVACMVAEDVLHGGLDGRGVQRAQRMLMTASGLFVREEQAFSALRDLPGQSHGLVQHSVTVAFLTMELARRVQSAEPGLLAMAGLAGMLHDIGRAGYEDVEHDPEHVDRGYEILHGLNMSPELCDAVRLHHERRDGSGFPKALHGEQIPPLAQLLGMVDIFDKVHSSQRPRVGVFDALRIVAQAYQGCFDEALAGQFVRLFR